MEKPFQESFANELVYMARIDEDMRNVARRQGEMWDKSIDHRNTARLKEIVDAIGWPTVSRVGQEASDAAWLLVQHASAEPNFMAECLQHMQQAPEGEVRLQHIALLEDRVLVMQDKPQKYGTQFHDVGNGWEPYPIIDPSNVDARRFAMGLDTLAENTAKIHEMFDI